MNYEEKYEQALERASKLRVQNPFDTVSQMMEHIFPELHESKDERIRKEIIELVHFFHCSSSVYEHHVSEDDMISWLEKQAEQKHWKPSEEQMKALETTIHISNFGLDIDRLRMLESLYNELKNFESC